MGSRLGRHAGLPLPWFVPHPAEQVSGLLPESRVGFEALRQAQGDMVYGLGGSATFSLNPRGDCPVAVSAFFRFCGDGSWARWTVAESASLWAMG